MRGQLQHPLNWILVVFAGAFFLLLFVAIIKSVSSSQNDVDSFVRLNDIETMIDASHANPDVNNSFVLKDVEPSCGPETGGVFTLTTKGQSLTFPGRAIFVPATLDGEITFWSQEYAIGMPITTTTYIVPDDTVVVFLDTVPSEVRDVFRGIIPIKVVDIGTLASSTFRGYETIIVVNTPDTSGGTLNGMELSIGNRHAYGIDLYYANSANPTQSGTLDFFAYTGEFEPEVDSVGFYSPKLLVGAFLAGSGERFVCARSTIEEHVHFVARLNKERLQELVTRLSAQESIPLICSQHYQSAKTTFEQLKTASFDVPGDLVGAKNELFAANQHLGRQSCPLVY